MPLYRPNTRHPVYSLDLEALLLVDLGGMVDLRRRYLVVPQRLDSHHVEDWDIAGSIHGKVVVHCFVSQDPRQCV